MVEGALLGNDFWPRVVTHTTKRINAGSINDFPLVTLLEVEALALFGRSHYVC